MLILRGWNTGGCGYCKEDILSGKNGVFDGVIETNTGETVGEEGKTLDDATITGGINWYFKTVEVVE